MSNYDSTPSRKSISTEARKVIYDFYGNPDHVGAGLPCPRCGASLDWNYVEADALLLHIRWHRNLLLVVRGGAFYPGMVI